jgi:alkylhydroperoxidase/carboxymuconolactone decarboxylase family protein YurZ
MEEIVMSEIVKESSEPTVEQILGMMRQMMGSLPAAIEKAAQVDESLVREHVRSRGYAMPPGGALDDETRTLLYLASAIAGGSRACIEAMANRAKTQKIAREKVLEAFRIARFALATKAIGDAESLFDSLAS